MTINSSPRRNTSRQESRTEQPLDNPFSTGEHAQQIGPYRAPGNHRPLPTVPTLSDRVTSSLSDKPGAASHRLWGDAWIVVAGPFADAAGRFDGDAASQSLRWRRRAVSS